MASCSQAIVTANSRTFPASPSFGLLNKQQCRQKLNYFSRNIFKVRASTDESDCNAEECAPDKEPTIYVAEGAISSGSAGSSSDGAENTVVIAAGLAVISIAAASLIVLQVGKNPTQIQTTEYSGPSLSYYINKFKPPEIVQASVLLAAETSPSLEPGFSTSEVPQIQVESEYPPEQPTTANTLSYGINLLVSAKCYLNLTNLDQPQIKPQNMRSD